MLLERFRRARAELVGRLEAADDGWVTHAALHPRLRQPMTVTDHAHFVAEHDYHLARITGLLGEFGAGRRAAPGAHHERSEDGHHTHQPRTAVQRRGGAR